MKPAARVQINGRDVDTRFWSRLVSLTIQDEAGVKSDTCEIELDARVGGQGQFAPPPIDSEIRVWIGYEPAPVYKGRFKVESWTKRGPARTLSISAKAAEMTKEIKATKTRSFHDTTLGEIVRKIAGEHGLGVSMDSELAARKIDHIDQQTESDMGFLSRLAKRNGATFKPSDGKVVFALKGSPNMPAGGAKPVIVLTPPQLSDWTATRSERGGHKAVKAEFVDPVTRKRVTVEFGSGKPVHRDRKLYGSKSEAESAAKATLGDLTRGKMTAEINAPGMPELTAEAAVRLAVDDSDVDGEYLVKSVTHSFSASGYTTSASLETEGEKRG